MTGLDAALVGLGAIFIVTYFGWFLYREYRRMFPINDDWKQPPPTRGRITLETRRRLTATAETVTLPTQRLPLDDMDTEASS